MAQAIALSATSIGGLRSAADTSVAREYHAGLAAMLGIQAALAAQRGYLAEELTSAASMAAWAGTADGGRSIVAFTNLSSHVFDAHTVTAQVNQYRSPASLSHSCFSASVRGWYFEATSTFSLTRDGNLAPGIATETSGLERTYLSSIAGVRAPS